MRKFTRSFGLVLLSTFGVLNVAHACPQLAGTFSMQETQTVGNQVLTLGEGMTMQVTQTECSQIKFETFMDGTSVDVRIFDVKDANTPATTEDDGPGQPRVVTYAWYDETSFQQKIIQSVAQPDGSYVPAIIRTHQTSMQGADLSVIETAEDATGAVTSSSPNVFHPVAPASPAQ